MPPKSDPKTERRILSAAVSLWRTKGERGLTLRAVAREARTSTPTVYRRFRNKQAILLALASEFRQQLIQECLRSATLEDACRRCVEFAEQHPNEYRLIWDSWNDVFVPDAPARYALGLSLNWPSVSAANLRTTCYPSLGSSFLLTGPPCCSPLLAMVSPAR